MYSHHGGDNQTWSLDTEGLISSQLDPGLFLTEVQGDVLLSSKKEDAVRWSMEAGGYFAENRFCIPVLYTHCTGVQGVQAV